MEYSILMREREREREKEKGGAHWADSNAFSFDLHERGSEA